MAFYNEVAMLFGAVDELQDGPGAMRAYFGKRGLEVRVKKLVMEVARVERLIVIQ